MEIRLMKFYLIGLFKLLKTWYITALTVLTAMLAPIGDLLGFVSLLIVFDFITGIVAARYRNESITSVKMFNSILKFVLYFGIIILSYVFDEMADKAFKSLFFDKLLAIFLSPDKVELLHNFKFVAAILFIITVREFKSLDENWKVIFKWSFFDTMYSIISKTKSFILYIKDFKKSINE